MIKIPLGDLIPARFIRRLNRFVLEVDLLDREKRGKRVCVYMRDTGRMKDYLIPGNQVYLVEKETGRYRFLLRAVEGRFGPVLADPFLDNRMVKLWLESKGYEVTTRGIKRGSSVFDLIFRHPGSDDCVCEVKGSNMYLEGWGAVFPDVYSSRAERHFRTLAEMEGCRWIVFVSHFPTNRIGINPEYPRLAQFLETAIDRGVEVHGLSTRIENNTWILEGEVPVYPVVGGVDTGGRF